MTRPVSLETASSVALIARQFALSSLMNKLRRIHWRRRNEVALTDYFSCYDVLFI